jgi:hypothetical protein
MTTKTDLFDDLLEDLQARWPEWHVSTADLGDRANEIICWSRRLILIDPAHFQNDATRALIHAWAHVELHDEDDTASRETQENEAELIVNLRMGRTG